MVGRSGANCLRRATKTPHGTYGPTIATRPFLFMGSGRRGFGSAEDFPWTKTRAKRVSWTMTQNGNPCRSRAYVFVVWPTCFAPGGNTRLAGCPGRQVSAAPGSPLETGLSAGKARH